MPRVTEAWCTRQNSPVNEINYEKYYENGENSQVHFADETFFCFNGPNSPSGAGNLTNLVIMNIHRGGVLRPRFQIALRSRIFHDVLQRSA